MKKLCARCGEKEIPKFRSKYCSDECCTNLKRGKEKKCARCRKVFKRSMDGATHMYCSQECAKPKTWSSVEDKTRICEHCNKSFEAPTEHSKFCTRECSAEHFRGLKRVERKEYRDKAKSKVTPKIINHIEEDVLFWTADFINSDDRVSLKFTLRKNTNHDFIVGWRKVRVQSSCGLPFERPMKSAQLSVNALIDLVNILNRNWYDTLHLQRKRSYTRYRRLLFSVAKELNIKLEEHDGH